MIKRYTFKFYKEEKVVDEQFYDVSDIDEAWRKATTHQNHNLKDGYLVKTELVRVALPEASSYFHLVDKPQYPTP